jgi:hypothetical protein
VWSYREGRPRRVAAHPKDAREREAERQGEVTGCSPERPRRRPPTADQGGNVNCGSQRSRTRPLNGAHGSDEQNFGVNGQILGRDQSD